MLNVLINAKICRCSSLKWRDTFKKCSQLNFEIVHTMLLTDNDSSKQLCFHRCLSVQVLGAGVSHLHPIVFPSHNASTGPMSFLGGYPSDWSLPGGGVTPVPDPRQGGTPSWGTPWPGMGYPPAHYGVPPWPGMGYPPARDGVPPSPSGQVRMGNPPPRG